MDPLASRNDLKLAVVGLGHVGLPTALGFADLGWWVVGADDDQEKAEAIAGGHVPFHEPGVKELLERHLQTERFTVERDSASAIRGSDVVFVCVGTPQRDDGAADLSQLDGVARTIASNLNGYKLIVEKSTTPVLTAQQLKRSIARYSSGDEADLNERLEVAVNPEFLREGTAVEDFFNPDRIVIGVESEAAAGTLRRLYRPLVDRMGRTEESTFVVTDVNTAEIIKHASNAFLATKVSFINMVADLCEATGTNVDDVALGMGMDPRIGAAYLNPGVGFGGYCLPKDVSAFRWIAGQHGVDFSLLGEVSAINDARADRLIARMRSAMWVLRGKTVTVWGLAFKPNTDDVREAPSLPIIERLTREEVRLRLYDPAAMPPFGDIFPSSPPVIEYCGSPEEAAEGADALLVLTEWPEFAAADLASVRESMAAPLIIDGRNIFDPEKVRSLGFEYHGVGRP